jgi:O-acetyl-ADP-ribose deacetylase (regulator of RNase III)
MKLDAIQGDITAQQVDAIVNAANSHLSGGGGVDGAIHRVAGPDLLEACRAIGSCSVGDVRVTSGFLLPSRWVIHAVGPRWQGGRHDEDDLLASCYRRSLHAAKEIGAKSIAFPAISTGVYGFPKDRAATIAVRTLLGEMGLVDEVRLVAFDQETYHLYRRLID